MIRAPAGRLALLLLLPSLSLLLACGDSPAPVARPLPDPDPESVARGRKLFAAASPRVGCARCHGTRQQGSNLGPPLQGIAAAYSTALPEGEEVTERFEKHLLDPEGWPALRKYDRNYFAPMPSYRHLKDAEIADLVAFLLSLR